jgi:hypothetical protein
MLLLSVFSRIFFSIGRFLPVLKIVFYIADLIDRLNSVRNENFNYEFVEFYTPNERLLGEAQLLEFLTVKADI